MLDEMNQQRPGTVDGAVALSIIGTVAALPFGLDATTELPESWRLMITFAGLVLPSVGLIVLSLMCLRGYSWPRFLLAVLFLGGVYLTLAEDLAPFDSILDWAFMASSAGSTGLLFAPSANRWFRTVRRKARVPA